MLLDSEIQSYKDELKELRKDAKRIKKQIVSALKDGEEDSAKDLIEKEKSLLKYIQDLVDELGGADGRGDHADFEADEQRGSFGHTLVHSTIVDEEEDVAGEDPEDYSISDDPRADWEGPSPSGSEQTELASEADGEDEYANSEDLP